MLLFARVKYYGEFTCEQELKWSGCIRWLGFRALANSDGVQALRFLRWNLDGVAQAKFGQGKKKAVTKTVEQEQNKTETPEQELTPAANNDEKNEKEPTAKLPEKKAEPFARLRKGWDRFRQMEIGLIIEYSKRLLKTTLKAIWPRKLSITGTIGLENPADTGKLLGAIYSASQFLGKKGTTIQIDGDFESTVFVIHIKAKGHFRLFTIGLALLRWYIKPPIRALFKKDKDADIEDNENNKEGDDEFDRI